MQTLDLSELKPLPDKNNEETERLLASYKKHIEDLAAQRQRLELAADRQRELQEQSDGSTTQS